MPRPLIRYAASLLLILTAAILVSDRRMILAAPDALAVSGTVTGPGGPGAGVWIKITTPSGEQDATTDASGGYTITVPGAAGDSLVFAIRPPVADRLAQVNLEMTAPAASFTKDFNLVAGHLLDIQVPSARGDMYFELYPLIHEPSAGEWVELDWIWELGRYQAVLPYDAYHAITFNEPYGRFKTTATYDLRTSDQVVTLPLNTSWVSPNPTNPPDPSRISFGTLNSLGEATITGAPGAALPLSKVLLVNLKSHHQALVNSQADGSFSAQLFAPPGSPISIRHGPAHWRWYGNADNGANEGLSFYPGTIIHRPHTHSAGPGQLPFASVGGIELNLAPPFHIGAAWGLEGSLDTLGGLTPGGSFAVDSQITLYGHDIDASTDINSIAITAYLDLYMLYGEDGRPRMAQNYNGSSRLTPTGFPILDERFTRIYLGEFLAANLLFAGANRITGDLSFSAALPASLPPGVYRPALWLDVTGVPTTSQWRAAKVDIFTFAEPQAPLPLIAVTPTRSANRAPIEDLPLVMRLLMNDLSQGQRGVGAEGDAGVYGAASFIVHQDAPYILPAVDAASGQAVPYRLDPFLPMLSYADRATPTPPLVPLDLPSGQLCISIVEPSGASRDLGCEAFAQTAHRTPGTRSGLELNLNSEQIKEPLELRVASERFLTTFDKYGPHTIQVTATVADIWGNTYFGGGSYPLWIAEPLDLDFGVLPGTPLAAGDSFNPSLQVIPGVPADVSLTLTHFPLSDPAQSQVYTVTGQANPYGYFSAANPPTLSDPGEYRVDLTATYVDPANGEWMMAAARWGGVVMTPDSSADLIARGRRGFDSLDYVPGQWFINCVTEPPAPNGNTAHMFNPYFNGDIIWGRAEYAYWDTWGLSCDGESLRLVASLQDTVGVQEARILTRAGVMGLDPDHMLWFVNLADRSAADELPVFSSTNSGWPPALAPEDVDQRAYFYLSSQRPGVRVREGVAEEGPTLSGGYWRLDTTYDDQLGVGYEGDLPNDFKFQYVGVVYQDLENGVNEYLGHGSGWVHIAQDDPTGTRVMPPFSGPGNGGWTTQGGPIMTLQGEAVHLFILPTGVRPGTVLEVGDRFHFAGHLMPTLDSQVQATVTSPSGVTRTVSGQANKVGYFYDPADDFDVDEAGLWTVDVIAWHDGQIGDGESVNCNPADPFNPALPCPSGDVLGSQNGRYAFYVVPAGAPRVGISQPLPGFLHFVSDVTPVAIDGLVPAGLSSATLDYTFRMAGFILEHGQLPLSGSAFSLRFDPASLHADFPNLDLTNRADWQPGLSDTFSLDLFLEGDSPGGRVYRAGTVTIQGERVYVNGAPASSAIHLPVIVR